MAASFSDHDSLQFSLSSISIFYSFLSLSPLYHPFIICPLLPSTPPFHQYALWVLSFPNNLFLLCSPAFQLSLCKMVHSSYFHESFLVYHVFCSWPSQHPFLESYICFFGSLFNKQEICPASTAIELNRWYNSVICLNTSNIFWKSFFVIWKSVRQIFQSSTR